MPSMLDGDVGHILGGQRRALPAMIPREDGADLPGESSVGGFRWNIQLILTGGQPELRRNAS